ncbi:copper homeostasis protein CutC [Gordonia caeni]|uniref:PF03932 family protein CutC n=1 Tax=Gordonia caeni TaxID=1007097 RepID=A0ABP7PGX8_9ACTN
MARLTTRPRLEIAVQDGAGAAVAAGNGADRVELCTALGATGGLTPSPGTLAQVCATGIDVHVLIRNRPGGFVYDDAELDALAADIALAADRGAAGVVIGALDAGGNVDVRACRRLIAAARTAGRPLEITFHRALDTLEDPVTALRLLADLGVDRVLTSGGAARAGDGLGRLARLVGAGTGVEIMAGGGVRLDDLAALAALGVDAIHLSAKRLVPDPGVTGPGGGTGGELEMTDPTLVAAARRELDRICDGPS